MATFTPLNQGSSLTEKVTKQIREAVTRGEYTPGDRLPSENELAEAFGVSRTSIRESIKVLAGQGIIEVKRGVGAFVIEAKPDSNLSVLEKTIHEHREELLELFQIRRILEEEVAAQAACKATNSEIVRLRGIIEAAEAEAQKPVIQLPQLNELNASFHAALLEVTGNHTLKRIMNSLIDVLTDSREITLKLPGRQARSVAGHKEILDAIIAGDANWAREAMRNHLKGVEDTIIRMHELKR